MNAVNVRGILQRTAAGLHSVAGDCKTDLGTPMRQAAEDVDKVVAVFDELIDAGNAWCDLMPGLAGGPEFDRLRAALAAATGA